MPLTPLVLLSLAAGATPAPHPRERYGPPLQRLGSLGVGPTMAVAVSGGYAYLSGRGTLRVADLSQPERPKVVGQLGGLGNTRQLVVDGSVAYVASREDGLFVIDVGDPEQPALLARYDSVEFATGLGLSGEVLFIACRQFGVELVDIRDPTHPRHLSLVRAGEAQSVTCRDGWLYAGVWGSSEVVVADVRDPWLPTITARVPLRGFADGVAAHGSLLLVATGHHSPEQPRRQPGDPGYGRGHGLEILSLDDPARPKPLGRLDLPPFYQIGNDMWSVHAAGNRAWVGDSHNGLFEVDLADPAQPRGVAHWRPDWLAERNQTDYVGGFWPADGLVYVAGGWTDLHVIAAPEATPPAEHPGRPVAVGPRPAPAPRPYRVFPFEGQVHQVTFAGDLAYLALGSGGVQVAKLEDLEPLHHYPTAGFALDLELVGDRLYVAEGSGGLSVWRVGPAGSLAPSGHYRTAGAVKQVVIPPPGRYALLHVGAQELQILDLAQEDEPRLVCSDRRFGLLYGDQIADGLVDGRWAAVFWHVSGIHWYDLAADPPVFSGDTFAERMDMTNGLTVCGSRLLVVRDGGYLLLDRAQRSPVASLPLHRVTAERLSGKPVLEAGRLYLSDRSSGLVRVLDATDPTAPRLLARYETAGNPGRAVVHRGRVWIPGGYEGLLQLP